MVVMTEDARARRRRGYQRRGVVCAVVFLLMVASVLVPHIGVRGAEGVGRSMFPASQFFLFADITSGGFGYELEPVAAASGINLAYYGLSFQHLGLVLSLFTFWALAAESVGRWTRRGLLLAGWLLSLSAPVVLTAYRLLEAGGIPAYLGSAWAVCLVTGIIMILGARAAKDRLDSTWYWARPEWNG